MPLDSLTVTALVTELNAVLKGARIDKIHQPGRDELVFTLRTRMETGQGNVKLLVSGNPQHPRVHISQVPRDNPDVPPMFCMLLRKHVTGARILDITQPSMERLIELHLEALDELGFRVTRRLLVEVMGRQSNIILVDQEGRIIDCLRRIERDLSTIREGEQVRQLTSGFFYRYPFVQDKKNPQEETLEEIENTIEEGAGLIHKYILQTYRGLSPLLCREIAWIATGAVDTSLEQVSQEDKKRIAKTLFDLVQGNSPVQPSILEDQGRMKDFSYQEIGQYEGAYTIRLVESLSLLLDQYYKEQERSDRIRQKGQGLLKTVSNAKERVEKKIALQEQELLETENRERLRELGDIITANLHRMTQGMEILLADDFYGEEGSVVEIKLNPLRTPQKNAAAYYKEYNKGKKANEMLQILLEKGKLEQEYLCSVLEHTKLAQGEQDLVELRQELEDTGYLKQNTKQKGKVKRKKVEPMEFVSSSGLRISVGKNNTQNDLLTTKQAYKSDIWFHTQKIHGSHVILWTEGKEADDQSIVEAASLAAWFSQGRERGKVPVDYTPIKYVKKPNGARPGMVIYTTYETMLVTPKEELVEALRKKKK